MKSSAFLPDLLRSVSNSSNSSRSSAPIHIKARLVLEFLEAHLSAPSVLVPNEYSFLRRLSRWVISEECEIPADRSHDDRIADCLGGPPWTCCRVTGLHARGGLVRSPRSVRLRQPPVDHQPKSAADTARFYTTAAETAASTLCGESVSVQFDGCWRRTS
jgi:hypothetical protein